MGKFVPLRGEICTTHAKTRSMLAACKEHKTLIFGGILTNGGTGLTDSPKRGTQALLTMQQIKRLRSHALSLPGTTEEPHFEKTSFRVRRKIFATYDKSNNRACLKLTEANQDVFCTIDSAMITPVPNKWGRQGWTFFQLDAVRDEILIDAVTTAYCTVAPRAVAQQVRGDEKV